MLSCHSYEVDAVADVECPRHLISPAEVDRLVAERAPQWVPLAGPGTSGERGSPWLCCWFMVQLSWFM